MKAFLGSMLLALGVLTVPAIPVATPAEEPARAAMARLGFSVDRDLPLEIGAEELRFEAGEGSEERILFRRGVEVVRGTLTMYADQVEALYPEGTTGRPSRIVAREGVRIVQGAVEARCATAIFDGQCSVLCRAGEQIATLRRGEDVLSGREIHFDLCKGTLEAKGSTRVEIHPRQGAEEPPR